LDCVFAVCGGCRLRRRRALPLLSNPVTESASMRTTAASLIDYTSDRRSVPLDHLKMLEAESIQILREVVAEFERPVMLYSVGKDSSCMLRLAQKAFYPGPIPFPLLHVDTTYKFQEMISFRDEMAEAVGARLI